MEIGQVPTAGFEYGSCSLGRDWAQALERATGRVVEWPVVYVDNGPRGFPAMAVDASVGGRTARFVSFESSTPLVPHSQHAAVLLDGKLLQSVDGQQSLRMWRAALAVAEAFKSEKIAGGACPDCGWMNAVRGGVTSMACGGCAQTVHLTWVSASNDSNHPCDIRCLYARGDDCECSCVGENHRAGYLRVGSVDMVPQWVRDRDRRDHEAKQERKEAKARQARLSEDARRAQLVERWPALTAFTSEGAESRFGGLGDVGDGFLSDMFMAFRRGDMTDRQADTAAAALVRLAERDERRRVREAEDAARRAAGEALPVGRRVEFAGAIVSVREEENYFRYRGGIRRACLVETDDGFRVWGTLPDVLRPQVAAGVDAPLDVQQTLRQLENRWPERLRGRRVRLVASVERSDKDPLFGFYKRPQVVAFSPDSRVAEEGLTEYTGAGEVPVCVTRVVEPAAAVGRGRGRSRVEAPVQVARVQAPAEVPVREQVQVCEPAGVDSPVWREFCTSIP